MRHGVEEGCEMGVESRCNKDVRYARLHRLLSAAQEEAKALGLKNVLHLSNMALMQTVVDWEGLALEKDADAKLNAAMREKARLSKEHGRATITVVRHDA